MGRAQVSAHRRVDALVREERRGHRGAVVQELVEELSRSTVLGSSSVPVNTFEDLDEPQERDGASGVEDPEDRYLLRRAADDDTLAGAHERPGEARIDEEGGSLWRGDPKDLIVYPAERDLLPADELRARLQQLLVAVVEVEVDEGRKVRPVGSHVQGQQGEERRPGTRCRSFSCHNSRS